LLIVNWEEEATMNRMRNQVAVWALVLALGAAGAARANNLQITNVTVTGRDNTTAFVQFDISWENSWRYAGGSGGSDPLYFHDAAWVFFKVLPDGRSAWEHVTLEDTDITPDGYETGTGTPIELIVPDDRVGMFVRRSGVGAGTTSVQNVKAVWNIASNSLVKTDKVMLQAFGLEMVYVAEGAFWAGNTNGIINSSFHAQGNDNSPIYISSTNAFTIYWGAGDGNNASVPNTFPNGYAAFYCMKYSITQGQYADFLNALTRDQQETRCMATVLNYFMSSTSGGGSSTSQHRNTVRLTEDPGAPHPRVYTTTTPDRACNWLSWTDGAAFADWAGLRPMTELEYEKACRGPLEPVAGEYAFGTNTYTVISGLLGTDGTGTETYTAGNLIVSGSNPGGPVRVGIFATVPSTREQAGTSYWGIMELSGNLWERAIMVTSAFTGLHGNGVLSAAGNATVSGWPSGGLRGGSWQDWAGSARVSDRGFAAQGDWARDPPIRGWRAVRSAPSGLPAAP